MNNVKFLYIAILVVNYLLPTHISAGSLTSGLAKDSIYQLSSTWLDQNNTPFPLKNLLGKRHIVSMIYTHCMHTCPTIVATMQAIEEQLSASGKNNISYVLISLTPDSDTPEVLKSFAANRKLDLNNWTLLSGNASDVRGLAMALNIKYKTVADNEVAHSNLLTALDEQGRILFQQLANMNNVQQIIERLEMLPSRF